MSTIASPFGPADPAALTYQVERGGDMRFRDVDGRPIRLCAEVWAVPA
jgi:hypothetical protein